jgi:predicted RNA methylase
MAETKHLRNIKKQLGQFMTPLELCRHIVSDVDIRVNEYILEPSFGDGNFLIAIIEKMIPLYNTYEEVFKYLYGIEYDPIAYNNAIEKIKLHFGNIPKKNNLVLHDYLIYDFNVVFKHIIGNPPFGGTIDLKNQKMLEKKYGNRYGLKIKKETYSFFIVKSIDCLSNDGDLNFILSDTFITIKTMKGLRNFMMNAGNINIKKIKNFSKETKYPMIHLQFDKSHLKEYVIYNDKNIYYDNIKLTENYSWNIDDTYIKYFYLKTLNNYITCTSGMTTGKNEYFVREIVDNSYIIEKYKFDVKQNTVVIDKLKNEMKVYLPNTDYLYYNKIVKGNLYVSPKYVIYWKNNGESVKLFKKQGPWYLHGIGGLSFFEKEGITWNLIDNKINARYLPNGYILDSGCPSAFLKSSIDYNELYFILGWLLSDLATNILKNVINHTRNIQGKDIEGLPYPEWVSATDKKYIINLIKDSIEIKKSNSDFKFDSVKMNHIFNEKINILPNQ